MPQFVYLEHVTKDIVAIISKIFKVHVDSF